MMVMGQTMYGSPQATSQEDVPGRSGGNGHAEPSGEDVIEGEYHET